MNDDTAQITGRLIAWARAIERRDRDGILAHHASDLLMFDFPSTVRGIDAYDRTWDFFYDGAAERIVFRPSNIAVMAGGAIAFLTCDMHCDGTAAGPLDFRLTMGLKKRDGEWTILHEHHSLVTTEERFVGPDAAEHKT